MRYLNADEAAAEDWQNLSLIVVPDLNWFANESWQNMKCWQEELAPGVGTINDCITSYTRSYELMAFHGTSDLREGMSDHIQSLEGALSDIFHRARRLHDCVL